MNTQEPEWVEERVGTGDNVTMVFMGNTQARPVEEGTFTAEPKPKEISLNMQTGAYWLHYGAAPAFPQAVTVRYAWRPPILRDATVCVRVAGQNTWATMEELRDAIQRGNMGR